MAALTEEDYTNIARRVVYELLGRRWVWPAVTTTERLDLVSGQRYASLEGRPVISIASVRLYRADQLVDDVAYVLENGYRLRFTGAPQYGSLACGNQLSIEVTYTYGSPPPLEILAAIDALAAEIALAYTDPDSCSLPDTVVSVSRQGLSFQLATDFLDKGRTGIAAVDRALSIFNPGGVRRKSRVFGPAKPYPRRRNTSQANWTGS